MYSAPFSLWYRFARALVSRKQFGNPALLPEGDHGFGKGAGHRGERPPDFAQADIIVGGFRPFFRSEVSCDVLAGVLARDGGVADRDGPAACPQAGRTAEAVERHPSV